VSPEREVIDRVLAGDRSAFEELVRRYQRLVAHLVARMVDDPRDREEICQDVFLRVHRRLGTFRGESKLSVWIARNAYRTALNRLEQRRLLLLDDLAARDAARETAAAAAPTPLEEVEAEEVRSFLRREIGALPPHHRAVVTLYHLEGLGIAEIAQVTGRPEGTIKSDLFRARARLKERLLAHYSPEELMT
jgi:RNA polymerase sigma-70 factor (ECF subfamily)